MRNKKGFTLIELLAVIVILAIIAVIATPIITGIIEDAKKSAAADSAYGALDSVRSYWLSHQMDADPMALPVKVNFGSAGEGEVAGSSIKMSGTKPTAGTITMTADGTYTVTGLVVNGYSCTYASEKFTCTK